LRGRGELVVGKLRTTRALLDEARGAREAGESIRFWEERSRWSEVPRSLWRAYSETWEGSDATVTLERSSTFRRIGRSELEEAVGLPLARRLWAKWGVPGNAKKPSLVIMCGAPLSGKTTLAKGIIEHATETAVLIENDSVRAELTRETGHGEPSYTVKEHRSTYNVSFELIRLALANQCHVVFDATNRTDRGREGAYAAASEAGGIVLAILVNASDETVASRFRNASPAQRRAYEKLGNQTYTGQDCTAPLVEVNTEQPVEAILQSLVSLIPIPLHQSP
jgi:predicted kinase